jgi:PRTRC genetic system protein E
MFKEIAPLLRQGDTILCSIALAADGKLVVGITPRLEMENEETARIINRPISITATAEELDAEFHNNLGTHCVRLAGSRTTFESLGEELQAAEKQLKAKVTDKKAAPKPVPVVPQPDPQHPALF